MISQKAKNGLNLHRLVLSKKKTKKLPPISSARLEPQISSSPTGLKQKISETIPQANIHSFNNLGLSQDVFYLPEREKKIPQYTTDITRKKLRKKNKLPRVYSGRSTTLENHRKIKDSWNKFHKKTKENQGYSRDLERFISKYFSNTLF